MADHLRSLAGRGKLRQKDVLDLRSRIALAKKEGFVLKVCPVDDIVGRQPVAFGQRDHDTLAPKRHGLHVARARLSGDDGDVEPAALQVGEQAPPRSLDRLNVHLREAGRVLDQAGTQISGRE